MRGTQPGPAVVAFRPGRRGTALAVAGLLTIAFGALSPALATPGGQGGGQKVTICHRTNSTTNPYTVNTVDVAAVNGVDDGAGNGDHYLNHVGPVFDPSGDYPGPMSGDEWGDIIPPVAGHDGLNWTAAGRAIWSNGCTIVVPPTTTTTQPPTTTTEPPTTTTEPPTTTTEPPTTTTTEPPATAATGGGGGGDEGGGATIDQGGGAVVREPEAVEPGQGAGVANPVPPAATDGAALVADEHSVRYPWVGGGFGLLVLGGLLSLRRRGTT